MATNRKSGFLEHLRGAFLRREWNAASDAQLLTRYVQHGESGAFETILRRHGAMFIGKSFEPAKGRGRNFRSSGERSPDVEWFDFACTSVSRGIAYASPVWFLATRRIERSTTRRTLEPGHERSDTIEGYGI